MTPKAWISSRRRLAALLSAEAVILAASFAGVVAIAGGDAGSPGAPRRKVAWSVVRPIRGAALYALRSVATSADGTHGYAAGDVMMRLSNGKWTRCEVAGEKGPGLGIDSIALNGAGDRGWAVGALGVMRLENGRWTPDELATRQAANAQRVQFRLRAVALDSAHDDSGWAVGDKGTVLRLAAGRWKLDGTASVVAGERDLFGLSLEPGTAERGWAVGVGVVLHLDKGVWTKDEAASKLAGGMVLTSVALDRRDGKHGWIVGSGGIALRLDGGRWVVDEFANAVSGPTALNAVAYGSDGSDEAWAAGINGAVFHWDGGQWSRETEATAAAGKLLFYGLTSNPTDHWIVGSGCVILHGRR